MLVAEVTVRRWYLQGHEYECYTDFSFVSLMNHSDDFRINNRTGEIALGSNLDHVTADTVVTLVVIAADHGVPPLTSNGK